MRLGEAGGFFVRKVVAKWGNYAEFLPKSKKKWVFSTQNAKKFDKKGLSWHNKEDERNQSAGAWERSGGGK